MIDRIKMTCFLDAVFHIYINSINEEINSFNKTFELMQTIILWEVF